MRAPVCVCVYVCDVPLPSPFVFSPSYSSVPAVHIITTVYIAVVRTGEIISVCA